MSLEQRLSDSLKRRPADDRQAEERAWQVVAAAAPTASGSRRRPLERRRAAAALAVAALLAALAVSPAGAWIGDGLGVGGDVRHTPASPTLRALPGGGELLAGSHRTGAWVVHGDGSRRRLGPYRDVSWSPNGLFVAAVRGRQLVALTPTGEPRWALTRDGAPTTPRWAPSGLRVAYLSAGTLRAVAGDGSGDAQLASRVAAVAPAWRPGGEDEIAVVDRSGRVALISAVTGVTLWRSEPGVATSGLAWSPDGDRLAVLAPDGVRILDRRGARVARLLPRVAATFAALGYSPRGRRLAVVERGRHGDAVDVLDGGRSRRVFATAARLHDPLWSPDGRWLLVSSPAADQWLFLRTRRPHRVVAISDVAAQLGAGDRVAAVPRPTGWCCAR
jgi:hypothetical protein